MPSPQFGSTNICKKDLFFQVCVEVPGRLREQEKVSLSTTPPSKLGVCISQWTQLRVNGEGSQEVEEELSRSHPSFDGGASTIF